MSGTLASLALAMSMSAVGGLFSSAGDAAPAPTAQHHRWFPPPEEGGLFFYHFRQAPLPWSAHYTQKQLETDRGLRGHILQPGPGNGWGFPNNFADGYGWVDYGTYLPLANDRTPDYFFHTDYSLQAIQTFLPSVYNPYQQRGQRYIPYSYGVPNPLNAPPGTGSMSPVHPDQEAIRTAPAVPVPTLHGRVEASPMTDSTPSRSH